MGGRKPELPRGKSKKERFRRYASALISRSGRSTDATALRIPIVSDRAREKHVWINALAFLLVGHSRESC